MAEGFFRKAIVEKEDVQCLGSAGVAAYDGDRISPETAQILESSDATLTSFSSRVVTEQMLSEATDVYAMTQSHLAMLVDAFPEFKGKCRLVCDHLPQDGGQGMDVPDPIGMGFSAYQQVGAVFGQAIPSILNHLGSSK